MSGLDDTLDQRRSRLAADIARQRSQLASAYHDIARPIHYFEYGMRGFGLLRQNPWILSVVPAGLTILTAITGLVRGPKSAPSRSRPSRIAGEEERAARPPKTLLGHAMKWGGRGMKAYRLYQKIRKFL